MDHVHCLRPSSKSFATLRSSFLCRYTRLSFFPKIIDFIRHDLRLYFSSKISGSLSAQIPQYMLYDLGLFLLSNISGFLSPQVEPKSSSGWRLFSVPLEIYGNWKNVLSVFCVISKTTTYISGPPLFTLYSKTLAVGEISLFLSFRDHIQFG